MARRRGRAGYVSSWVETPAEEVDPEAIAAARRLLVAFRRRYGLSLEAAASRLGVWNVSCLARWEDGLEPMPLWAQSRLHRTMRGMALVTENGS